MNDFSSYFSFISAFVILIGVLFLTYVSTRWLAQKSMSANTSYSRNMVVLDRLPIGQDKMLLIVQAGERKLLLGSGSHGIHLLFEFSSEEMLDQEFHPTNKDFLTVLRETIGRGGKAS